MVACSHAMYEEPMMASLRQNYVLIQAYYIDIKRGAGGGGGCTVGSGVELRHRQHRHLPPVIVGSSNDPGGDPGGVRAISLDGSRGVGVIIAGYNLASCEGGEVRSTNYIGPSTIHSPGGLIKYHLWGSLSRARISSEMMPCSFPSMGILPAFEPVATNMFFTCTGGILVSHSTIPRLFAFPQKMIFKGIHTWTAAVVALIKAYPCLFPQPPLEI
jgi:hypothetical protein